MSQALICVRCGKSEEPLAKPPYPGPVGEEIQQKICASCWAEWQRAEVMVINELRLNFMDPGSQDILTHHMREFLTLEAPEGSTPAAE